MTTYTCPLCKKTMDRDLIRFLDHGQSHVIDKIKEKYPEWVAEDGTCEKCRAYYEKQRG